MSKAEAFQQLRRIPVLRALPAGELDRLFSQSDLCEFQPGDRLAVEGEPGSRVFVLAKGRVSVRARITPREELVLATRGAGDWVGEMALIDGSPRSASLVAEVPVCAVSIPKDVFLSTVASSPSSELDLLRIVSLRLRESDAAQLDALRSKNERLIRANARVREENTRLRARLREDLGTAVFLGSGEAAAKVRTAARRAAASDLPVLLLGETGTGKELVARAIHASSDRAALPFVALNAALFSGQLLDAELFGYARGAFTGAVQAKPGLVEAADRGTLFLDELADMPRPAQAALLRFLESGEFRRLGDTNLRRAEVRLIAATSADLDAPEERDRLRADLLYRLDVFRIELPPLRQRPEDIPELVARFSASIASRLRQPPLPFSQEALEQLRLHSFPGNVRELQNEIQRIYATLPLGSSVELHHLSPRITGSSRQSHEGTGFQEAVQGFKARLLLEALEAAGGNRAQAARSLGLHRSNFVRMLRQLDANDRMHEGLHSTAARQGR